jgi:hypothetical protein
MHNLHLDDEHPALIVPSYDYGWAEELVCTTRLHIVAESQVLS